MALTTVTKDRVMRKWPGVIVQDLLGAVTGYRIFDKRRASDPMVTAGQTVLRAAGKAARNVNGQTTQVPFDIAQAAIDTDYP